jgi:hypothetical protein
MHDVRTGETYRAQKIANEGNWIRFRKAVSQARTPNELRLVRLRLREQEEIALELNLGYLRRRNSDRY